MKLEKKNERREARLKNKEAEELADENDEEAEAD